MKQARLKEDGYGDVNDDGAYGYRYLDHYWTEEGRYAYFIKVSGKLAGFVMIRPGGKCDRGQHRMLNR